MPPDEAKHRSLQVQRTGPYPVRGSKGSVRAQHRIPGADEKSPYYTGIASWRTATGNARTAQVQARALYGSV
ncbi:hypothetical protein D3C71_1939360 [compost metagenome]